MSVFNWFRKKAESPQELNDRAMLLHQKGKVEESTRCAMRSAEMGDPMGKLLYAAALLGGKGVQQDVPRGIKLMKESAAEGCVPAQMSLSDWYMSGSFVEQDEQQGFALMQQAAQTGYPIAERKLGLMYAHALGTGKDLGQAHHWLEKAAAKNDTEAQYQLGLMYGIGLGVESSMEEAYSWFAKAADLGCEKAIQKCEELLAACGEK